MLVNMSITKLGILWVVPPPRIPVANEGLGWDPLYTKNGLCHPGGDWNPGRGDNPRNTNLFQDMIIESFSVKIVSG